MDLSIKHFVPEFEEKSFGCFGRGGYGRFHNLTHYCSWWAAAGGWQFLGSPRVEFIRPIILNATQNHSSVVLQAEDAHIAW